MFLQDRKMDRQTFYGTSISSHRFLRDAAEFAEDTEGATDIAITGPPPGGDGSDIEQLDDDNLEENVMPKEIASEVDVFYEDHEELVENISRKSKRNKRDLPKWKHSHIDSQPDIFQDKQESAKQKLLEKCPDLAGASEWAVFEKVFQNMLTHLVCETNKYAKRDCNIPNFNLSCEEMYNFLGLLLLSGYNLRTSERDYWSKAPDLSCRAFAETMSRNRFQQIKHVIHAADNQSLSSEKMAKISPLYEMLNQSLLMFGVLHEYLSIDESMVPYFGRHSCKQFIRGKPIRFGFKCWVIASSSGMPYKVTIYQGKNGKHNKDVPLGTRVVMDCLEVCDKPTSHHIFFYNFFTSFDLISNLKSLGYRATGTVRENRTKGCPVKSVQEMKKNSRGSYDYRSDGEVEVVRWNDNAVVSFCSNATGIEPITQVKRWEKKKGTVMVSQPKVVAQYNSGMGGVDLMDRALADYRPAIKGKKWYWPLLVNVINIAVVYSWRVYQLCTNAQMTQKEFRRSLVAVMLKQSQPRPRAESLPGPSSPVPIEVRTDNRKHYPQSCPVRRCTVCKKNCRIQCSKCNKSMHLNNCFQIYHEK